MNKIKAIEKAINKLRQLRQLRQMKQKLLNHKNIKFVEIGVESSLSNEIISITGEIKHVRQYGFNLKSGGWSLYNIKNADLAYFLIFRKKNHKKFCTFDVNRIKYVNKA
jgi:hypothetical protein